jgi:hypothetical protein
MTTDARSHKCGVTTLRKVQYPSEGVSGSAWKRGKICCGADEGAESPGEEQEDGPVETEMCGEGEEVEVYCVPYLLVFVRWGWGL